MSRHEPSGRIGLGLALATVTMVLWGSLPIGLQGALRELDPVTLTTVRMLVAGAVLGAVLAARRELPTWAGLRAAGLGLFVFAVVMLTTNFTAFIYGLDLTSASNAQMMIQLGPLLLGVGGLFVFGERYTRLQWLGVAVLVSGLGLFFAGNLDVPDAARSRYVMGTGIMVVAAVTWAAYGLAQKQLLHVLPSQPLMCVIYAACGFLLLPASTPGNLAAVSGVGWLWVAYCAGNTLIGYGAFSMALEHAPASRVSAILAVTPVMTLVFARVAAEIWPAAFAVEVLSPGQWVGGFAVVAGSLATTLGAARPDASPSA